MTASLYKKMPLRQDQIRWLAKLTALRPDALVDISTVVDSFDTIANTPTGNIDHITRSGNPTLTLRRDAVHEDATLPDQLLNCSPQRTAAHQIVLAGIMQ